MEQLKLTAYKDEKFESKKGDTISLPVVVEEFKFDENILYNRDRQLGSIGGVASFEQYEPKTLSLRFIIDATGVVEGTKKDDKIYGMVQSIERVLYEYQDDGHRPAFVTVCYAEILFKGQLSSMNVDYTLFTTKGVPLRANVSLTFKHYMSAEEERKKHSKQSPDMSRIITVKEGETLPFLCRKMYGDSQLVPQVARFNNLNGFRDIPAGTTLLFPPLKKT
jgi:hypothetical protein